MGAPRIGAAGTHLLVVAIAAAALATARGIGDAADRDPFYVIAHMTNTIDAVQWALNEGANAVEMDVRFSAAGEPGRFHHGGVCDCACSLWSSKHVCSHGGRCDGETPVPAMLSALAQEKRLALVVLDSKVTVDDAMETQRRAGERIIDVLETNLFGRGYGGIVVVSVAHPDAAMYLATAARRASASPARDRILFTFDEEGGTRGDASRTLQLLAALQIDRVAYGTGASSCVPCGYEDAIATAASRRSGSGLGLVYAWTLDRAASMKRYIEKGANGIMTNKPAVLLDVVKELGLPLAVPSGTAVSSRAPRSSSASYP
jgi:glycerophosphoryl diester phosphodiesterase